MTATEWALRHDQNIFVSSAFGHSLGSLTVVALGMFPEARGQPWTHSLGLTIGLALLPALRFVVYDALISTGDRPVLDASLAGAAAGVGTAGAAFLLKPRSAKLAPGLVLLQGLSFGSAMAVYEGLKIYGAGLPSLAESREWRRARQTSTAKHG